MNHPDIDYLIVMERRRDELLAAAQSRLVKEALAVSPVKRARQPFHVSRLILAIAHGLSFLGERLLSWSCRLEGRYQALAGNEGPSPCA